MADLKEEATKPKKEIRVWKLGSLEHKLIPTREGIEEFRRMLKEEMKNNDGIDVVCGPDVQLTVFN
jgi:hypothetical protein